MNIYERMSNITSELTAVAKNLNVGFGKSQYKAVGEADILAAVKPLESKHGIYSYPFDREIIKDEVIESTSKDGSVSQKLFMRVRTVYRFVNVEEPTEFIDITSYGDGVDTLDKAPGKAMTYSDKYALMKAYKIITGDDPDQFHSDADGAVNFGKKTSDKITVEERRSLFNKAKELFGESANDYIKSILDTLGLESTNLMTKSQYKEAVSMLATFSKIGKE